MAHQDESTDEGPHYRGKDSPPDGVENHVDVTEEFSPDISTMRERIERAFELRMRDD